MQLHRREVVAPAPRKTDEDPVSTAPEKPAMWRSKSAPGGARKTCHGASSSAHGKGPRGVGFPCAAAVWAGSGVKDFICDGIEGLGVTAGAPARRRLRADEVYSR